MRETVVETYLRKKCKLNDFLCFKFISPSQNGVPDRILIGQGYVLFVETKAPKKDLRKLQRRVVDRMKDHGAIIFVINTKEKVDKFFEEIKTKKPTDILL